MMIHTHDDIENPGFGHRSSHKEAGYSLISIGRKLIHGTEMAGGFNDQVAIGPIHILKIDVPGKCSNPVTNQQTVLGGGM